MRFARRTKVAVWGLALGTLAACAAEGTPPGHGRPSVTPQARGEGAGERRPFTVVATGDVIPYPSIIRQAQNDAAQNDAAQNGGGAATGRAVASGSPARTPGAGRYDFSRILSGVKPVVDGADLAICHMETPYGPPEGPFTGYPAFQSPPDVARGLRATGYDSCSTASNHTLDAGPEGIRRTLDALDAAGVRHAGSARSAAEARTPARLRAGGAEVAHLSYTYGTNGIPLPEGQPWAVNLLDPGRVVADARAARRAGADVVLVSLHWGTEWQQEPDRQQLDFARRLTAARTGGKPDIDLLIGTHNHVPQPYEKVNGTWVVYGLGDQVASFVPEKYRGNEGSMARFTFAPAPKGDRWTVSAAEFLAGHSDLGPPFRVVTATDGRFPDVRERVRKAVLSRGAAQDGLKEMR
ncbi:CapA family protein [Streptomyces pathocidini]|uniref:CapA family protein n=1 Tax=Streptomyces pathocidini TaxID=1650571 RepID=UPI003409779E